MEAIVTCQHPSSEIREKCLKCLDVFLFSISPNANDRSCRKDLRCRALEVLSAETFSRMNNGRVIFETGTGTDGRGGCSVTGSLSVCSAEDAK